MQNLEPVHCRPHSLPQHFPCVISCRLVIGSDVYSLLVHCSFMYDRNMMILYFLRRVSHTGRKLLKTEVSCITNCHFLPLPYDLLLPLFHRPILFSFAFSFSFVFFGLHTTVASSSSTAIRTPSSATSTRPHHHQTTKQLPQPPSYLSRSSQSSFRSPNNLRKTNRTGKSKYHPPVALTPILCIARMDRRARGGLLWYEPVWSFGCF